MREIATIKDERRDLVRMMIQEVDVDVATKKVVWVKAHPDVDVLFQLLRSLRLDDRRRFWIVYSAADENICDIGEDLGQITKGVKIAFPMSHNALTSVDERVHGG